MLDRILDAVDQEAKNTAQKQQRQVGWITDLDTEQAVFTVTGTQKHDLSMYIERKLREIYCTQYGVTCARNHTQYALYANIVMRGELLWSVHLHTVTQRHHMQHLSETRCTVCKLPITHAHTQADCPLLFLRTWFLYIKLSHLLPALNPSWHTCLPTPLGTLIATPAGHLNLCVISLTGEVSSQSMHQAAEHGATNTMMTLVPGPFSQYGTKFNTWRVHQLYRFTRNTQCHVIRTA